MATKKQLAEQVMRILAGGQPSRDFPIDKREIMYAIEQERDTLIQSYLSQKFASGDYQIEGNLLSYYSALPSLERVHADNSVLRYITLPVSPLSLPDNRGIYQLGFDSANNSTARFHDDTNIFGGFVDSEWTMGTTSPAVYNMTSGVLGVLTYTGGNWGYLHYNDNTFMTQGSEYEISFTLTATAGKIRMYDVHGNPDGLTYEDSGTYKETFVFNNDNNAENQWRIFTSSDFRGSITGVSIVLKDNIVIAGKTVERPFVPMSGHGSVFYGSASAQLGGRLGYYPEGKKCFISGDTGAINSLNNKFKAILVAASRDISDDDTLPITPELESVLIKNMVQLFGIMVQRPEDKINDNIK
jgi:hypothetical protein